VSTTERVSVNSSVADLESRFPVGSSAKTISGRVAKARAASYADRVLFLADGRIVDELEHPTVEGVLDTIKRLGD
jgi:hypothetical protein